MGKVLTSPCADCGMNTTPCTGQRGCRHGGRWEWYMVYNHLWAQFGVTPGFLCIGCLTRRFGRPLHAGDFTTAPVNDRGHPWNTERLEDALGRRPPGAMVRRREFIRRRGDDADPGPRRVHLIYVVPTPAVDRTTTTGR